MKLLEKRRYFAPTCTHTSAIYKYISGAAWGPSRPYKCRRGHEDISSHYRPRLLRSIMFIRSSLLAFAMLASAAAHAHDLGKALTREPSATFVSAKPLFEVERCIMMSNMPEAPMVYRTPDRPDHSLVYWQAMWGNPMVVELIRDGEQTRVIVRNSNRTFEDRFKECV